MSRVNQIQIFLIVLIIGFLAGPHALQALSRITESDEAVLSNTAPISTVIDTRVPATPIKNNPYADLALDAKSVYVWDISTHRKLFSKNEDGRFPLASVTKMMMALVAVELLPEDTKITIDPVDISQEGDSGLYAGEKWSLSELLKFTLIASSNDGASAIAGVAGASLSSHASLDPFTNKRLFIEKMNEKAQAIGLLRTHFSNESGLDLDSITGGAYGTSRDMTMLFEYIFKKHPELFTSTTYKKINITSESAITHHVANTNEGAATVAGFIGGKTGYTDLAGGNLVVVVDVGIGHPVAIAVLGSTREGRFTDVRQLIDATIEEITTKS